MSTEEIAVPHETVRAVERTADGASVKGLKSNVLGPVASVTIGVASMAPAYSLAATMGLLAATVGLGAPFLLIVSFVPMILVASGFYYMNRADPDCGETFIWTTRAFGAPVGWVIGFASVLASALVMGNLGQVAALYMLELFGLHSLAASTFWVTLFGVAWIVAVGVLVAVGIEVSKRAQYVLMTVQIGVLVTFAVWALIKGVVTRPEGYEPIRLSHFFTTHLSGSQLAAGVTIAVFLYWGWDTVVAVNEESEDSSRMPGLAAAASAVLTAALLILVVTASQAYHGAAFLADNPDDVLAPLARDVMGQPWDKLMLLCVSTSAIATILTTLLTLSRQTLSMAAHKGLPSVFGRISAKHMTPFWGTVIIVLFSVAWFVFATWFNVNLLYDAITGIGMIICLTYGGTGLAAAVYYRKELLKSGRNFIMMGLAPAVGAFLFALILIKVLTDLWNPDNSYSQILGLGGAFFISAGTIVLGIILMIVLWVVMPAFFRRRPETWPGEGEPIPYADERVT